MDFVSRPSGEPVPRLLEQNRSRGDRNRARAKEKNNGEGGEVENEQKIEGRDRESSAIEQKKWLGARAREFDGESYVRGLVRVAEEGVFRDGIPSKKGMTASRNCTDRRRSRPDSVKSPPWEKLAKRTRPSYSARTGVDGISPEGIGFPKRNSRFPSSFCLRTSWRCPFEIKVHGSRDSSRSPLATRGRKTTATRSTSPRARRGASRVDRRASRRRPRDALATCEAAESNAAVF